MIVPTVGRKVWYRPSEQDKAGVADTPMEVNGDEPLDATVIAVWGDRLVNLAIFDIYGTLHARRSVPLLQDGDARPHGGRFAEWMPYQTAQAAKVPTGDVPQEPHA
jgi:hypothetical protein